MNDDGTCFVHECDDEDVLLWNDPDADHWFVLCEAHCDAADRGELQMILDFES